MKILIRNILKTDLSEKALYCVVKTYSKDLKKDVIISFDKRVTDALGNYYTIKGKHIIKVSPDDNIFSVSNYYTNKKVKKYCIISTILHELGHALECERKGYYSFWKNKRYGRITGVRNTFISEYLSECETKARIYEESNFLQAVKCYDNYIKILKKRLK